MGDFPYQDLSCFRVGAQRAAPLPHLRVTFGNYEISCLVDSGAARCLVNEQTFKLLKNSKCIKSVENCNFSCFTATHEPMPITQCAKIHFKVGNFSWTFDFLVAPSLHAEVILGADFMKSSGLVLDLYQGCCWFSFDRKRNSLPIRAFEPARKLDCESSFEADCFGVEDPLAEDSSSPPDDPGPDLSHLSSSERRKVHRLLRKYQATVTTKLGCCNTLEYDIVMNNTKPVHSTPYSLSPPKMEFLRKHIEHLLGQGVIRPSKSSFSSPAFLVPKGDTHRMVIDYRRLNQHVDIESVPLPDINTAFNWFSKAKYFCVLDLNSAYHQIPLSEKSKAFTAFCVPFGLYEWNRVPFGLATGAQVLTRLGNELFHDLRFRNLVNFLDDFVLYAETFEELMTVLDEVLSRFQKAGMTINPKKLQIAVQKISYLGHLISSRGLEIDPERTRAIREFEPPKDAKGIARFLGMIQFYGKFIPHLAERALPLNKLRKKGAQFVWTDEQQAAFEDLKQCIISPPILRTADFTKEFLVQADGSPQAIGAVLMQKFDGSYLPVAYASRTLTEAERKYSQYEIECLGVLFACDKFRIYLEHREFQLECDNQALS